MKLKKNKKTKKIIESSIKDREKTLFILNHGNGKTNIQRKNNLNDIIFFF